MLMAAVAPLAVTQNVIQLDHDDAWYLHRAVCFSRSFYDFSAFGIYTCMRGMFKSPIAGLLLLPAGPLKHDMVELDAAPFVLACLTFGLGYMRRMDHAKGRGAAIRCRSRSRRHKIVWTD